jgi:MiaB-like tRNA modifying enzyme
MKKFKSFFIKTFGCTHNLADSQKMGEILLNLKLKLASEEVADLIIVNSCGVKTNTEQKILAYLDKLGKDNRNVIITGCLPFIASSIMEKIQTLIPKFIGIIHPINISHLESVVESFTEKNATGIIIDKSIEPQQVKSKIFIKNQNSPIGILQISEGCIGNCSFCATKNARGSYHAFPIEDLTAQIDLFLRQNKKEIWLTSQDCGINVNDSDIFFDLCNYIAEIPEKVLFRIGMINPEQIIKEHIKYSKIFESERFYKFLHIPIQSANDRILQLMNRRYTREDLEFIFSILREKDPKFSIATDIIAGFPSEEPNEFQDTLDFLQKFCPDVTNISKFSSRPGTSAKNLKPLDSKIIKARTSKAAEIVSQISLERNKMWVDWEGPIFLNEVGKNNSIMGRNNYYKCIVLKEGNVGDWVFTKIIDAKKNFCLGTILDDEQ